MACGDHAFFRVGAGAQGSWLNKGDHHEWENDNDIAAAFALGYRSPINDWLWWDIQGTHNSQWFRGWPFNDQEEDELTALTIGLEFKIYQ